MLLFSDMLYMLVRYALPSGPMCLRCLMLTLSGSVELLFLLCFIATWPCVVVSVIIIIITYYSIALISSSARTCSMCFIKLHVFKFMQIIIYKNLCIIYI